MSDDTVHILILEDNESDAELIKRELRRAEIKFTVEWAQDKQAFLNCLDKAPPNLILSDYSLPGFDGLTALTTARHKFPDVPVVIVSGAIGEEIAIEAMKAGATDYVLKQRLSRLGPVVKRALEEAKQLRDRRRAEKALRESEAALRRSNQDLEHFAYVASHDLQEPLRQVNGFVALLEKDCGGSFDARAKEYFAFIKEGTLRMHSLINDLLEYSRISRKTAPTAVVDLNNVLRQAIKNLRGRIEESKAKITAEELPAVNGNATALMQVFQNLLGNAIKFRKQEGPVQINIGARQEKDHWLLSVKDNGIGFAQDYAEKIFMIFQRLHGREKYDGTGIGLAICKRAIEQHGGTIWAESDPGKGATFYFTLPA